MRIIIITCFILLGWASAKAQDVLRFDLSKPARTHHDPRFRVDLGFLVGGCQGSFMRTVDWSGIIPPNTYGPKQVGRTYYPGGFIEAEYRPLERLGILVHYSSWSNNRYREYSSGFVQYYYDASTWLTGGRWYWTGAECRVEWYSGLMGGWARSRSGGDLGSPRVDVTYFAHQITLIGLRTTRGLVGMSMELGQGYKGFLCFGLSVAF